jgi:hypothetical protein
MAGPAPAGDGARDDQPRVRLAARRVGRARDRPGSCAVRRTGPGRVWCGPARRPRPRTDSRPGERGGPDPVLGQPRRHRPGGARGLAGRAGRAASPRARRPAVRGPGLADQSVLLRVAAVPRGGGPADVGPAGRGRGASEPRRQGRAGRRIPAGRAGADQFPADQPGRAQARDRYRRRQRPGRLAQHGHRRDQQQRHAAAGRCVSLQPRGEPRGDAGQGRVQERPDGADSVRAADSAGAREPCARKPAVDQQVLHHGPGSGPQLPGVGGRARADRLRHLLPQS